MINTIINLGMYLKRIWYIWIFVGIRHSFTGDHESESDFLLRGSPSITRFIVIMPQLSGHTFQVQISGKLVKVTNK